MIQRLRSADPRMITILLIVFVQIVGASMALPILPLFALRQFDMSPQLIAMLVSSYFAAQFLAGPTIGRLSDRNGRLPILIISQIGTVISFVMLAYAQSAEMLFLSRILDGITGGNIVVAQAYVTDIIPKERRTQALGLVFAALGIGFIFGPAIGGILAAAFDERIPFLVAAVAAALTVILTWFTLDESLSPEQRETNRTSRKGLLTPKDVFSNVPLLLVLFVAFGAQFGLGILQATFALYGEAVLFNGYETFNAGISDVLLVNRIYSEQMVNLGIGLLLATVGFGQFLTQIFLLPRMLDRYSDSFIVVIGSLIRAVSLYIFAVITSPYLGPAGAVTFAMGAGLMMPPLQSLATNTVADEVRGGVLGWYQSSLSLSTIFATAFGGFLFSISPTIPYWFGGTLFVVVALPGLVLWHWERQGKIAEIANIEPVPEAT